MRFESKRLREAARDVPCVLCNRNDGTVVLAHLPGSFYGMPAGMGQKTHDWLGAHLCHDCHAEIDSTHRRDAEIRMMALCRTLERLFNDGTLTVR